MLTRIVKLTFAPAYINDFLDHFETVKHKINDFPGCHGMQLMIDKKENGVVFTYSVWESEEALNNYRYSELFQGIWPKTKSWFSDKPQAWSLDTYFNGFE